jgi:hypothetical protein
MVVVDEDGLFFLEPGMAHRAGILLDVQEPVELLAGQAVPDELVRLVPSALGSGVNDPSVDGDALRESLTCSGHRLGSLATPSVPRGAGAMGLLARHPLSADRSIYSLYSLIAGRHGDHLCVPLERFPCHRSGGHVGAGAVVHAMEAPNLHSKAPSLAGRLSAETVPCQRHRLNHPAR